MNYSQMSYAKLYQMESWSTEELLFSITQFQMQDSLFGTKISRLLPTYLSKTLLAQEVWITAEHLSLLSATLWTSSCWSEHPQCSQYATAVKREEA